MILALSLNVNSALDRRSTVAVTPAPPVLAAPTGLTVALAEASLAFGDTATVIASVDGFPAPMLTYQWTLDGADVAGQTGPAFEGVPVGVLQVRVTAANSAGGAWPVTSDPVTVAALAPGAFSAGQWAVEATGVSGEVAITLATLPAANGAPIAGVERQVDGGSWADFAALASAAPWDDLAVARTWNSGAAAQDWAPTSQVSPFVIYQSPWGAWDMAPGDGFETTLRADQTLAPAWAALRTVTGPLQLGAGLPKGAPMIILGAHFDLESSPNPFTTGSLRGIRSDAVSEWTAMTRLRDRSAPDASLNVAVQTYATVAPTQATGWIDGNAEQWFDIQVRHWWPNFPVPPIERLRGTVTLGGVEYAIYRNPTEGTVRPGAGTIGYGVIPTTQTLLARHDMKAIIDWIVADHNAVTAQNLSGLYLYQCATWIEPRSGFIDATTEGFEVRFNGVTYGRLNRTEGGVTLDAPYTLTGLADGAVADIALRAVNGVGAGAASDMKAATPFIAAAAPSSLTVTIAEASLGFGDTATAVVSVSGNPTPTLAYQWTLDGVDAEGQTGSVFDGVPVGALRVRVTATNTEGVAGPVTSAPVTVTAKVPGAFSAGQWNADSTGVSGEIAITLFGMPPENGAAITSVERQVDGGARAALAGIALNTAYTVSGLTDDQIYSFNIRAVNSVGAGPESDAKTETPFAPVAPAMLSDNEWTFQPVAASTDLEVSIAQATDWTGFSLNLDASGAVSAPYTALNAGPVNLAVPTISGTPALGATMAADTGRWATLPGVTSYAYQWKRNGVAISGATAPTYNLVSADASTNLSVVVTPTDAQGTPAAGGAESVATAIGAFAPATPDLFAVAVGALRNANAFDMGDAAWTNDSSTTITALAADGPYLAPQTITVSVAQNFRGRKTSIGALANAAVYRCAAMVKAGVGNRCQIMMESGSNNATVLTTDVSGVGALTVTHSATRPGTITNAVIEDAGGGYRRIRFDYTPNAAATHTIKANPFANVVGASVDVYGCGAAEQA